ncbi:MAG: acyl-CoA dehydrogenase [Hyphomicrobiales bacterium]
MDLNFSPQDEAFHAEIRAFLREHLPFELSEKVCCSVPLSKADYEIWHDGLNEKGWLAPNWPKRFGDDWWCQGYSEPGAGSDLAALNTKAVKDGDHYVVNGQKTWTTLGQYANMIFCLVRTDPVAEVTLSDTPATLLMEEAYRAIAEANAAGTLALAAQTLGAMETSLDMTQEYLVTRKQFGRPIGAFQALAHRLVDLKVEMEQARSAVILGAAYLADTPNERDRVLAATKNILGRVGRLVAEDTIQMHGGIGMTDEYALGRFSKRITMADHRFGDVDHKLERFIALSL